MNEKSLTVLEQYELKIKGTYRSKGNYGCTTDKGKYILQEYNNSDEKMKTMSVFYDFLEKNHFITDRVVANKEGKFVTVSEYHRSFSGRRISSGEKHEKSDGTSQRRNSPD